MQKATVNNIPGQIIEVTQELPNIGLGPATLITGYKFQPDAPPPAPVYEFEKLETLNINGRKHDSYRAWQIEGGRIHAGDFAVPHRTPRSKLQDYFLRGE